MKKKKKKTANNKRYDSHELGNESKGTVNSRKCLKRAIVIKYGGTNQLSYSYYKKVEHTNWFKS